MSDLTTKLVVEVDSNKVDTGLGRVKESFVSLGNAADQAGQQAAAGVDKIGSGGIRAAAKVERATTSLIGSIQRTTAVLEAGTRSSSDYYRVLAQQRGVSPESLKPYLDQLDAVNAKQRVLGATTAEPALARLGKTSKETAAAMRLLPAQITDITTSLASGQPAWLVAIQQGGQIKDSFGGIGPAARALGGYIGALVNPFTIAAAAATALTVAYFQGSREASEYNKALVLSGNAAGTTVGQLRGMAQAIASVAGTQGNAAAALTALAASGAVAARGLEEAARAAVVFERATGTAIADTVKQFAELGKAPLDASLKLNDSLHYLTLTTYGQIKALEEQGRTADAAAAAQRAYADALTDRAADVEQRLGSIERAWRGVKDAAKGAWDAMLSVGRGDTLQEQLAKVNAQIAKARAPFDASQFGGNAEARAQLQDNIALAASLQKRIDAENGLAAATKKANDQVAARARFDAQGKQFLSNAEKAKAEIKIATELGKTAGASAKEMTDRIAAINAKYVDKSATRAPKIVDTSKADLAADIAAIQAASQQLQGIYTGSERVLEAVRAAGGLSDRDYYEAKREFIRLDAAAQEDALQKSIARYQQEKLSGKDAIDNQRRIADAQAKLAEVATTAATQITVTTIQEEAAIRGLALAYLSARQAAQDYFDTTQRQQDRALAGLGKGVKQRGLDAGISQIEDRYAGQRRDLENQKARLELEGKFTEDARRQYEDRLGIINEFQAKSIASFTDYYAKLDAASRDWSIGASEALQNYSDAAKDAAGQAERAITNAFNAMEDALVKFTLSGKLDFKSLADSIIADIARIAIRQGITGPIAASFNGALKGGAASGGGIGDYLSALFASFGGGRAGGGPVEAGKLYPVNERGPELLNVGGSQYLMMGDKGGTVTPNAGAAAPGRTQHINITIAPPAGMTQQTSAQFARDAARQISVAVARGAA